MVIGQQPLEFGKPDYVEEAKLNITHKKLNMAELKYHVNNNLVLQQDDTRPLTTHSSLLNDKPLQELKKYIETVLKSLGHTKYRFNNSWGLKYNFNTYIPVHHHIYQIGTNRPVKGYSFCYYLEGEGELTIHDKKDINEYVRLFPKAGDLYLFSNECYHGVAPSRHDTRLNVGGDIELL